MGSIKKAGAWASISTVILSTCALMYMFVVYRRAIHTIALLTIILTIVSCLLLFYLLSKDSIRINRRYLWIFTFVLYSIVLIYLLFFSNEFARDHIVSNVDSEYLNILRYEWKYGTNFIPFASIKAMLEAVSHATYIQYTIINLFGNIIAFMPFAFFMKILLHKQMSIKHFFWTISFLVILVEFTQFLTMSGTLDVDDYILNVAGSMLFYGFLNTNFLQTYVNKIK